MLTRVKLPEGFSRAGDFICKVVFHVVRKLTLVFGGSSQFLLIWVSPQAAWMLSWRGSSFPPAWSCDPKESNVIGQGLLNLSLKVTHHQFHHNKCIGSELLSWSRFKRKGIRLYFLKAWVSKYLKTYFKTTTGIKRNLDPVLLYSFIHLITIYWTLTVC